MLAIIPARGGSKGLPGKNIKLLAGKPLIAHTVEQALNSKHVTKVLVSTDDKEIARVALEFGAEVPFMRPAELASDTSLSIDTYIYTLDQLANEYGEVHDNFLVLQPTSPLRSAEDIDKAVDLFQTKKADSVISFCEEHHSIFWHKYVDSNGVISPIFTNEKLSNRQELKKTYYPNGAIYVFRSDLIRLRKYYSEKTYVYLMERQYSIDIDSLEDFEYAEFVMNKYD
jgi:N-acylneuraminate cytidylyltransferase/CMP-N,N'-diacetyllegionaminic acid synthase